MALGKKFDNNDKNKKIKIRKIIQVADTQRDKAIVVKFKNDGSAVMLHLKVFKFEYVRPKLIICGAECRRIVIRHIHGYFHVEVDISSD